jgi:hypothetical protein
MTVLVLRESRRAKPEEVPDEVPVPHPSISHEQAFVAEVRQEIDGYFCRLKQLNSLPPDGVFATLSAITARLGEIRLSLVRSESRRLTALRTREIDPLIDECDRQFRLHSRIQACRTFDWEVSG